jgi:cyanophycinase
MPNPFPTPKGKLLAIGGHEQREKGGPSHEQSPEFILQRFIDEMHKKGTIVVIPTASEVPEESAQDYVDVFLGLRLKHVEVLNIQSRANNLYAYRKYLPNN